MRILYVSYDDLSGNFAWTVHVASIVNRLAAKGHEVHLLAPEGPVSPDILVETWPMTRPRSFLMKLYWIAIGALLELAWYRWKLKPDVTYVRGIHPTSAALLRCVFEVNGLLECEATSAIRRWAVRVTHKIAARRPLITVSPLLREALRERYGAEEVHVISNGADPRRFRPMDRAEARRKLGLPDGPIAVYVGSFYEHHGVDLILDAMAQVPARLVLVGDGATRPALEAKAKGRDVLFAGEVPHASVPDYLAAADVGLYVLRNRYDRQFGFSPLKLYEYMASARPVAVATDHEEIASFVRDSRIGAVAPLDPQAFGRAIEGVLKDGEAGARGRALVESTYNWDRAATEVESVLMANKI